MKILLLAASLCLAACSGKDEPSAPKAQEGRAETQSIRNTQAIGYDGRAIADKVDKALKANEEVVKRTEKESADGGTEEKPE